jgi:poly(3-hydroxybutyrate) depolymerase
VVLEATLFRPEIAVAGDAAVVALHGCGGPYPARDTQWRDRLLGRDRLLADCHILLFPDSFGSRGLRSQCRKAALAAR